MTSPDTPASSNPEDQPPIPGLEFPAPEISTGDQEGPSPLELARQRAPQQDRISPAQADLGGGIESAEQRSTERHLLTRSVENYAASRHWDSLSRKGTTDPEVKRAGGIARCKKTAKQHLLTARKTYLESQELPSELPENPTDEQQEAYDRGVKAWIEFRTGVLQNPDELAALARELSVDLS